MKIKYLYPIISLIFTHSILALADISVIVHQKNEEKLDRNQIKNIFMGKVKSFPNGESAKPLDQNEERTIRKNFYVKIADKDERAMKVYWSNLIFTGDGTPPKSLLNDSEIKKYVSENKNAIGYVDSKSVDSSIRTVFSIKESD